VAIVVVLSNSIWWIKTRRQSGNLSAPSR